MLFLDEEDLVTASQQGCDDLDARAGALRGDRGGGFGCGHGSIQFVSQGFDAPGVRVRSWPCQYGKYERWMTRRWRAKHCSNLGSAEWARCCH
ncbi:hypothetical protein GCM10010430_44530 [Kitasatospora cystarginea]|uniref:Uncharacterized protein n=1 Tax=Kitasatospora cystarginea TaxID=58350 RepID=A0ABN3EEE6_9ACTN